MSLSLFPKRVLLLTCLFKLNSSMRPFWELEIGLALNMEEINGSDYNVEAVIEIAE